MFWLATGGQRKKLVKENLEEMNKNNGHLLQKRTIRAATAESIF